MMESVKEIGCAEVVLSSFVDDSEEVFVVSVGKLGLGGYDLTVSRVPSIGARYYCQIVTTGAVSAVALKRLAREDFKRVLQMPLAEAVEELVNSLNLE